MNHEQLARKVAEREADPAWVQAVIAIRDTRWNGKPVTRYPQAIATNLRDAGLLSRPDDAAVRADERRRLADLIERDAETLGGYTMSGERAMQLLAYMLRMEVPAGERFAEPEEVSDA